MKYTFLRPAEAGARTDFESKIVEIAMKTDRDFGSFANAFQFSLEFYEKSMQNSNEEDVPKFLKLVSIFRLLAKLSDENPEPYLDIQAELNSYITGNIVFDKENYELVYLDHKDFKNRYPNFKQCNISEIE